MNKKVLNKPIATDDQGNEVYLCQFSKKPVSINQAVMLGPLKANWESQKKKWSNNKT